MKTIAYALFLSFLSHAAFAEENIDGVWKSHKEDKVRIGPCDGSHCMTIISGKYAGTGLGKLTRSNAVYKGTVLDPATAKGFEIEATLSGKTLSIRTVKPEQSRIRVWTKQ